jgi:hypothetical protein
MLQHGSFNLLAVATWQLLPQHSPMMPTQFLAERNQLMDAARESACPFDKAILTS